MMIGDIRNGLLSLKLVGVLLYLNSSVDFILEFLIVFQDIDNVC
jgi:hypothetical protein